MPTEAARVIGHDVARPGAEEAVTAAALDRDMVEMLASALDASGNNRAGTMARQIAKNNRVPFLSDDALHILRPARRCPT